MFPNIDNFPYILSLGNCCCRGCITSFCWQDMRGVSSAPAPSPPPPSPSTGESGRCHFPTRCLQMNLGHTHSNTHNPSPGSIGGTQCSWRPLTPDTAPKHPTTPHPTTHDTHALQPGEGPITPSGGNYPESPLLSAVISPRITGT